MATFRIGTTDQVAFPAHSFEVITLWDVLEHVPAPLATLERVRDWLIVWAERGRDPSLLLPPGLALEEGRQLLDDHGDVLVDEVRPYI